MKNVKNGKRTVIAFLFFFCLLIVMVALNVMIGSVKIDIFDYIKNVIDGNTEAIVMQKRILYDIRLPRTLAALFLGGALSVSGFLLQTFFSNPIAGPFVLGISSGAKLIVALTMIFFLSNGMIAGSYVLVFAAFIGSMISMSFILLVSGKVKRMSVLIICGVMIGYICSAITDIVVTFADDSNIVNLHNWSLGSFSGMKMSDVSTMFFIVIISVVFVFFLSKQIRAFQMGEVYAKNSGVNIGFLKVVMIVASSVLSGCVTAFAGPVSFVGVAVPQIVKKILKTSNPLVVIPASFLVGANFCMICDLIARTVFAPTELSISTVTAVFGAPVVIVIMMKNAKTKA